jgi:poly-gamma-glutamate capsule biosynthesis protein CapA/YwtB (metallophosphatase superfamily)
MISAIGRALLLALGATLVHLLLLWLWNPRIDVGPPAFVPGKADRKGDIVVTFGGDTALTDAASDVLKERGYEYPLSTTLHLMRQSDLAVVNLETVVALKDTRFPLYKRYVYRMLPAGLAALKWAGVDAVSLANNHIKDHDTRGVISTLDNIAKSKLVGFGAGLDAASARRGVVFDLRGTRVGLLSYLADSFMHSLYMQSFAHGRRPGCNRLELGALVRDIARLKAHADLVFVVPHWGKTYQGMTAGQRFFAWAAIEAGADAVVGHHPHVHHPIATHRGKPIIYSLGNYAFGTPGREWLRHGLVARFILEDKRIARVEFIPLLVQNRIIEFKPEPLAGKEAVAFLTKLAGDSLPLGAKLEIVEDVGVLRLRP